MARTLLALVALLAIACYQTSTSNERTVRVNTVTGRSERLLNGRWVPIAEPTKAPNKPVSLGPHDGKPCPPEITELHQAALAGCIFTRPGSTERR